MTVGLAELVNARVGTYRLVFGFMITPCLSNELSKKWGPPLATPVRKICAAGDNGASQQSAAKCAVTLTSAGTAPALCAM